VAEQIRHYKPDVLITTHDSPTKLVQKRLPAQATLFLSFGDVRASGFVETLARPGLNMSGVSFQAPLRNKQLELLRDCFLQGKVNAVVGSFRPPDQQDKSAKESVGDSSNLPTLRLIKIKADSAFTEIEKEMRSMRTDAWIAPEFSFTFNHRRQLIEVARSLNVPIIFERKNPAALGAQATFDDSLDAWQPLIANQIAAIYAGVSISQLPVERPRGFDLLINASPDVNTRSSVDPKCVRRATFYHVPTK
jgi:putative tryptophan/tyrosine transport system substrate-binding protein